MRKPRKEYAYVAHRIDPENSQNLGDFRISYRGHKKVDGLGIWDVHETYHYASQDYAGRGGEVFRRGHVMNRKTLRLLEHGSRTYTECMKAVDRLMKEDHND